jgi:hypothetical protein
MKTSFETIVLYNVGGYKAAWHPQSIGHSGYQIHSIASLKIHKERISLIFDKKPPKVDFSFIGS